MRGSANRSDGAGLGSHLSNRGACALHRRAAIAWPFARVVPWLAVAASPFALAACGASVPLPKEGDHAGDPRVAVPYPPPPVKVEIVPSQPADMREAVWISGEWRWRGSRWEWQHGSWIVAPEGATYAPPAIEYGPELRVTWIAGAWHAPARR